MPTKIKLVAVNDNIPPEVLGDVRIRVVRGQTVSITRADLTNSTPEYYHEFNRPLGGVKIVREGNRFENILMPGGTGAIATLLNNNAAIYANGPNASISNGEVTRATLDTNNFKVRGNNIGSDYVEFVASSYNNTANTVSGYNREPAKLFIDVVSGTNRPPSAIGDNLIECPIGTLVPISLAEFTTNTTPPYRDPENDPPLKVKVVTIPPRAILTHNGERVSNGDEFLATDLSRGEMKVFFPPGTAINTEDAIVFDVADVGSGQYSGL
ncbi:MULTISPECIES: hypothetical protein [unclassified Myroides]|uniref:hypothetical protein n=1 Tax=unclassified Myroides TaxID=2642485 RepID=UPI003D2F6616